MTSTWSIGVGSSSKNRVEPVEVGGVEGGGAARADLAAGALQALGVARR